LLTVTRRTVALTARFRISDEHVERNSGKRGRFSLFFRDFDVGSSVLANARGGILSSEKLAEHLPLPVHEIERLAGEVALGVPKHLLKEAAHAVGGGRVEVAAFVVKRFA
jgi:hypothetical protein